MTDFRLFLAGRFLSVLATQMQWVAVGWYLYDLTGDPMTLGWARLAAFLPITFFTVPPENVTDFGSSRGMPLSRTVIVGRDDLAPSAGRSVSKINQPQAAAIVEMAGSRPS